MSEKENIFMDYTQNLHLPQWVATDRIHHDDFNDAFGRIDTAVAAKANNADLPAAIAAASPIVKLMDVTLTQAQTSVALDFSSIDLTQYAELKIHIRSIGDSYEILINNRSGSNDYRVAGSNHEYLFSGGYQDNEAHDAVLTLNGMGTRFINACLHTGNGTSSYPVLDAGATRLSDSALRTVNVNNSHSGYSLAVGSRFIAYGLKK